jgi:NAD/NADP transhydrogenase beta subunit
MDRSVGAWLVGVGLLLAIIGVLAWSGALSWFGRLPGDIRISSDNMRVYIPFTSMLLVSLVLNVMLWVVLGIFRR